jgi:hypothetical protein
MGKMVAVYDPRGAVEAKPAALAPRVKRLEGLRLAILDNTKWNANKLLRALRDALVAGQRLGGVNYYRKESFSKNAAPELIAQIARENDIVLTAIGD